MPSILFEGWKSGNRGDIPRKVAVGASCTWQVDFLRCHESGSVRACHFPRSGFRRLCSSSISRLELLPPAVHYLNKQAGRRGRLAAACTPSLPPSLFLYNKCVSRLSLHLPRFLSLPYPTLFLFFASSLAVALARSRARALETLQWRTIIPSTAETRRESR